jgi:hypothetical protein
LNASVPLASSLPVKRWKEGEERLKEAEARWKEGEEKRKEGEEKLRVAEEKLRVAEKGIVVGNILVLQRVLKQAQSTRQELLALPEEDLRRLQQAVEQQLDGKKDANGTASAGQP